MKKFLAVILILAAVVTVFAACGKKDSDPIVSGEYTYVVLEDNTAKITKYSSTEEVLNLDIPSVLDEYTVTVIGADSFAGVQNITVVNFPETATKIEERAFAGSSIKKAFLHRTNVTEIGESAFAECHKLVQVDLPRTLTSVAKYAFYYCDVLKVANFRGNTQTIDEFAFDASKKVKIYTDAENTDVVMYAKTYGIESKISEK